MRGGNYKFRALRLDHGNFSWGSEVRQQQQQPATQLQSTGAAAWGFPAAAVHAASTLLLAFVRQATNNLQSVVARAVFQQ